LIEAIDWRRSRSGNSFATSHARRFLSRFEEWLSENSLSSLTGEEEASVKGRERLLMGVGVIEGGGCVCEVWMKIERVGGEGAAVWKGKQINGLLGLLKGKVMGGGDPLGLYFFFIPKPNRFGSGWLVQAHQNRKPNRTFS